MIFTFRAAPLVTQRRNILICSVLLLGRCDITQVITNGDIGKRRQVNMEIVCNMLGDHQMPLNCTHWPFKA